MDVGISSKNLYGSPVSLKEDANKMIYPSLRVEKDIGDFEIGQKVTISCSGVVTSLRKDKQRNSVEFEIHEIDLGKPSRKQVGQKAAEDFLGKKS